MEGGGDGLTPGTRPGRPTTGPIAPFPWRPRPGDVLGIAGLFAASRLVLVLVGMVAWGYQTPNSAWRGKDRSGIRYALVPDQPLVDMWTRWDSWEYEEIARQGYWFDFDHKPRPYGTVACFPFYPLAIRALGRALGGRYVVAGLVVSNAAAVAGWSCCSSGRPGRATAGPPGWPSRPRSRSRRGISGRRSTRSRSISPSRSPRSR